MTSITIKNLLLDSHTGAAAVCTPLMGQTEAALRAEIELVKQAQPDLIEWRADYFDGIAHGDCCTDMLRLLCEQLPDMPILFTLRAASEGGATVLPLAVSKAIYENAIHSGCVDLVDTEAANDTDFIRGIIKDAHANDVKVILSRHHFHETPSPEVMVKALADAQSLSPDIVKLAVMPQTSADVLALLSATETFRSKHAKIPFITISMGALGAFTRVVGGTFGSALTYAALDEASATAPGQLDVAAMRIAMRLLSI